VRWDVRERAAAAGLDMIEPCWLVIWRVWARRFYAISAWPLPLPGRLGVESRTVAGLQEEMRRADGAEWLGAAGAGVSRACSTGHRCSCMPPMAGTGVGCAG